MNIVRLHQCITALTEQAGQHSRLGAIVFLSTLVALTGLAILGGNRPRNP